MNPLLIIGGVIFFAFFLFLLNLKNIIFNCAPNEVLIISGRRRVEGGRAFGYRIAKGGTTYRIPLFERVDRMDLTNMIIEVSATNAYSKGGIPLTVHGVANVKIAGHEPVINNAIERFLGRGRGEVMAIAKATLEGSLRGVLATLTPEQVNEDMIIFAEKLVHEVEADMTALGLVVDTMRIQNVHDEVSYLDSIGRKRSAEVVSGARIAEAKAKADSEVRAAENLEREKAAQISAEIESAKADAQRRLTDATTRRAAVVAEERSTVTALVAQAKADLEVQKARIEQVRARLQADVVTPARAQAEAAEALAKAKSRPIIEDGRARADALRSLAEAWEKAGPHAREVMLLQKLVPIIDAIGATVADTKVEKYTVIDARLGGKGPASLMPMLEQVKELYGVDLVDKLKMLGEKRVEVRPAAAEELPSN